MQPGEAYAWTMTWFFFHNLKRGIVQPAESRAYKFNHSIQLYNLCIGHFSDMTNDYTRIDTYQCIYQNINISSKTKFRFSRISFHPTYIEPDKVVERY